MRITINILLSVDADERIIYSIFGGTMKSKFKRSILISSHHLYLSLFGFWISVGSKTRS